MSSDDGFSSHGEDRPPDEPPDYAAFYRETVPGLITVLQLLGANREDAAECVQDTMLRALPRRWDQLTYHRAWCRKTATNTYYDLVRRRSREYLLEDMSRLGVPLFTTNDRCKETEEADAVRRLLGALPERRRQVLAWHVHGATNAEIAEEFGISESTVRTHISIGVADLEKILLKAREERT